VSALEQKEMAETHARAAKQTFFRQSGWMMITSVAAGVFMFAVHLCFSKAIGNAEYGVFTTLLSILYFIGIPSVSLQMVFTRQAAFSMTESQQRGLTRAVRSVGLSVILIWLAVALGVLIWQQQVLQTLHLSATALWVTIATAAVTMSKPMFFGVLQGKQDFLWLGWAAILAGVGRFLAVAIFVLAFGGGASAVMLGALCGELTAVLVAVVRTRKTWLGRAEPILWRPWLAKMIPLTLGFAAFQFVYTADPMFVSIFLEPSQRGSYGAAGTLSRALVLFTGQLPLVMFPKLVRSVAAAQKTDMFKLALISTALLAGLGAAFISYVLPIGIRMYYKPFEAGIPLLPPFTAAMAVLTVANVLINNLLAHERFQAVPWLVLVAVAYGLAVMYRFHQSTEQIIYTLGVFSILLVSVALYFTWRAQRVTTGSMPPPEAPR
jgi:O-antigen/teichoic acid export membrane protein